MTLRGFGVQISGPVEGFGHAAANILLAYMLVKFSFVHSGLRGYARCDSEGHRQGEGDESDGDTGKKVRHELTFRVRLETEHRFR